MRFFSLSSLLLALILLFGCIQITGTQNNENQATNETFNSGKQNVQSEIQTSNQEYFVVKIKNFDFDPPSLKIKAGSKVTWINEDSVPHDITSNPNQSASIVNFNSELLQTGESYTFEFTYAGKFTYRCGIHPSMKGEIIVE